ncbi:helix-turn-helix domain-containing protein [Clostridium beijerinckii]|uniref:Anaerobic benzoate catabolism transcriptional regulator n=1 Tax=Clostridium beijerinckii TaxID=1520 RepID=A0A1S8S9T7_CLOBE|nr:helix-turn-helix transcriptional regulator [Clostridium beijerinckii]MBE6089538.1 helix-turn-helix transcriptional regulator [Clostridium beijerinckii]NRY60877.1 transcriptional regulator with XRE-family HTH domain [Clostridium beijerinckii]OOM62320.1 anaerobic benzoate catabolism transcriptional regulator [Clostridium beijerinckii]
MRFILQVVRKNKSMTQKQLSEKTKLSISYIQKLEVGNRKKPSYEVATKLAYALGVRTEELFLSSEN